MAEPPASGCATRGAGFDGASFEGVSEELLLPEEIGCCAFAAPADALRKNEAARHRKSAEYRWKDDLVKEDTIGIRRSHAV
jgi:hypothetical protein